MKFISKLLSKEDQHTYGLILRVVGSLMWVYITAPIGAFVVILGEIVTWINFDEEESSDEDWKKKIERQLKYSKYKRK